MTFPVTFLPVISTPQKAHIALPLAGKCSHAPALVTHKDSVDHVAVQALLSAFATASTSGTAHPPHLLQTLGLVLLHLINGNATAPILPVQRMTKLLAPLTSTLTQTVHRTDSFD
ncbi:unnamed protein product, partial [Dicrocoelium dendriticum]